MQYRTLGNTGISASILGLGTVKWGRNRGVKYPKTFSLPTDREVENLLEKAKQNGINLIDTAPAYGNSEERTGKFFQIDRTTGKAKERREDWVICTKGGEEFAEGVSHFNFSYQHIAYGIERSLQRLHTDYLDIVLIHSDGKDEEILENSALLEKLEEIRQSGKIRSYGISVKTIAGGMMAVDRTDVVMVTYNPSEKENEKVIQYAHQKNRGVLIKKGFSSGHIFPSLSPQSEKNDEIRNRLEWIFSQAGVSSLITGTINPSHLQENVDMMKLCHFMKSTGVK